ncbi:MAG: MBL fold metallo-hydrolase [Blautia sp.]
MFHTPGHTPGGCCFYFPEEQVLFSGDTLSAAPWEERIFRGKQPALVTSVRRLLKELPAETEVYPGHENDTSIEQGKVLEPLCVRKNEMILIQLNKQDFEYDLHSLVKSFYPGEDVTVCYEEPENAGEALLKISVIYKEQEIAVRFEKDGQVVKEDTEAVEYEKNRKETKNHLKYRVYRMLSDYTGTTLPWGTLTGIRPTKIPMALLEQGMSNRDIADYMRKRILSVRRRPPWHLNCQPGTAYFGDIDYDNGYSLYVGDPVLSQYLPLLFLQLQPPFRLEKEGGRLSGCSLQGDCLRGGDL